MTPEVPYYKLSKQEIRNKIEAHQLLESTRNWIDEQARRGHPVSLPLAIATCMYSDKRKKFSRFIFEGEKQNVGSIFANLLRQIGQEVAFDFVIMAGGAILKSILVSLERGAVDGWADDIFIKELNANIEDTPIAQLEFKPSAKWANSEALSVRLNRETNLIRKLLVNDVTFLGFFQQDEAGRYNKLPESMQTFFGENPTWQAVLDSTLPIFREACRGGVFLQNRHSGEAKK